MCYQFIQQQELMPNQECLFKMKIGTIFMVPKIVLLTELLNLVQELWFHNWIVIVQEKGKPFKCLKDDDTYFVGILKKNYLMKQNILLSRIESYTCIYLWVDLHTCSIKEYFWVIKIISI